MTANERINPLSPDVILDFRPQAPFRLDFTAWALRRQPSNNLDDWDGETYRRKLVIEDCPVEVIVSQRDRWARNGLTIALSGAAASRYVIQRQLLLQVRRMLGLDVNLRAFYRFASEDPVLYSLVKPFIGMRPPRYPTLFEALVNAVACQQISLPAGLALLNRFSNRFGRGVGCDRAFPQPYDVYEHASIPRLRELGFSSAKARALLHLTNAILANTLDEDTLQKLDDRMAVERLMTLPGIGRWSAEYVMLRGLGRLSIFPGDDVGARNHLVKWLNLHPVPDSTGIRDLLRRWHPYAGLIYFHLLLRRLCHEGWLSPSSIGS